MEVPVGGLLGLRLRDLKKKSTDFVKISMSGPPRLWGYFFPSVHQVSLVGAAITNVFFKCFLKSHRGSTPNGWR